MGGIALTAGFPFSAVVGQEDVKMALLLNAIDPRIGGVLLRGDKGSGKSTLARGLAALLPGDAPFVELPVGATEDRVVGTLDIEAALTSGRRRFHPGLLAKADGGVLYVDEVNLLPDHLVDVLLDVAASGVNRVEREGVSESHPARFVLVGSMNPEEGELRPQLLDRFGLSAEVLATSQPEGRAEAVRRRMAYDADPEEFVCTRKDRERAIAADLAEARPAAVSDDLLLTVSRLCTSVGAQGLRADLVITRAAAALAGWEGRDVTTIDDVRRVAPMALAHRRRRNPLEEPGIADGDLDAALQAATAADKPFHQGSGDSSGDAEASNPPSPSPVGPGSPEQSPGPEGPTGPPGSKSPAPIGESAPVIRLSGGRGQYREPAPGRRSWSTGTRGRQIGDRVPDGPITKLALGATTRAAAVRRADGSDGTTGTGRDSSAGASSSSVVAPEDLREAICEQRVGNLLVLAVDASASMGVQRRMEATKGAVLSLLLDAYQRRDRVALVTFRGDEAQVILRPTGSVEVARSRLAELPTGGRTPLAAGIETALGVATGASGPHQPILILVSDGRATSGPGQTDPLEAAYRAASEVRRREISAVVVDVEDGHTRLGLPAQLAEKMGAPCLALPDLSGETLAGAIRGSVDP